MGQIGSFGDIIFETSADKILTPQGIKREIASRWNNQEVIGQKPVSEFSGPGLDTVTLTIILDKRFGVEPKVIMDKFLSYCRSGEAFTLIIGTAIGVDKWKITQVSQMWDIVDKDGHVISGKVELTFEEYLTTAWRG